ncbi:MAG: FecR domain-containing protein, partial [Desulfobacteraceae bacterium]
MKKIRTCLIILAILTSFLGGFLSSIAMAQESCKEWVAKVVSMQGNVQARKAGETQWVPVKLNDTYCSGDMIRLEKRSRAAVVLPNEIILRLDQKTTIIFSGLEKKRTSLLDLLKGAVHFFSRTPRSLKVATPFVNGSVEGTEFFVRVERDQTFLSIFEGRVAVTNEVGRLTLTSGQSAIAVEGQAPTPRVVVRPRDAVQWALYYPPIIDYRPVDFPGADWQAMVRRSIEFYWEGDLAGAFSSLEGAPDDIRDPLFFTYRAALLLSVGRVDEAGVDIERALNLDPSGSHAFALQSIIAVVQSKKDRALDIARKAVDLDPESSAARVALSYAQQAHFDLKGASASLQKAVKMDPKNALAWARMAELWLSFGYLDRALEAAQEAVALNPNLARTQTVLGFAYLTQIKTRDSKDAFQKAIELDQAAPLPRLGLALAKIREGELTQGRAEIEIAASLDPNNALIRSYLGKAYYEEKRDKLAMAEFTTAKELDPLDPTPYFYDAIRKQTVNRPVEALQDLQKSIELNDNRAVYRSRLLLDEDLAARSAT